ncbi:MAG: hypothetical protein ACE5G1_05340 [bacterium]
MPKCFQLLAIVAVILVFSAPLFAQPIWLAQNEGSFLGFEALKPTFDNDDNLTFATSAMFVSGRFFIGDAIALTGELPIAHAGVDNGGSETMFGNPYIGLELRKADGSFAIELGARLPLAADDKLAAATIGFFGDFDRLEAFLPDIVTFVGRLNFQTVNRSNIILRLRGGPTLMANADNTLSNLFEGDNSELFIDYSAQVGIQGTLSILGGITGRYLATEDGSFADNSVHQLGASAVLDLGTLNPGIQLRVPIDDDLSDFFNYAVGLSLAVEIQ